MGDHSRRKKRRRDEEDSPTSSSPSSFSSYSSSDSGSETEPSSSKRLKRSHKRRLDDRRHRSSSKSDKRRYRKKRDKKHTRKKKHETSRRRKREGKRDYSDSDESSSGLGSENSGPERSKEDPEGVTKRILKLFPSVAGDLVQLLQMIDDGQAVDIGGLSERSLIKQLRKLFISLNLKESGHQVFLLPPKAHSTLDVVGPIIHSHLPLQERQVDHSESQREMHPESSHLECEQDSYDANLGKPSDLASSYDANLSLPNEEDAAPKRRVIGPDIPSAEMLAAAAKLTEAQAELREAELDEDKEFFIGPPPPAVVKEVESANEAERFEEITRIMAADVDSLYDVVGVNKNMSAENIKKRYWKLSLMVHPDKCSHPQAHQAFIKLNKAFKDLRDPDKRKSLDEKIKLKEEKEEFKAELKAMREAAQWRRLQGVSMEGDDLLLADMDAEVGPKRDEWMTTLPPERKPGMTTQSTKFSRSSKEGRGDTSMWTDTPSERAQKAKMNYLEAYNETFALASNEQEKKKATADAELVDQYNKAKRSKSLVEKHQESSRDRSKKKSKRESVKEEWEGNHPWKPWDREQDLSAGRQSVKLDSKSMSQGLSSRFSSGSFQRNFL